MHTNPSHSTPGRSAPFLKWLGGKTKVLPHIGPLLLAHRPRRLIEPFVGGGSVFLGTEFEEYLLVDANTHLVELYQAVRDNVDSLLDRARPLFSPAANTPDIYNTVRDAFNAESNSLTRAAYFLYLNKFGYHGMCRYSQAGRFNVPFGHNKSAPSLPEPEIRDASLKLQRAILLCADFTAAFDAARPGDVIYCDPPYVDQEHAESFRAYVASAFGNKQQELLADLARDAASRGIPVIVSNHLTPYSRELYHGSVAHEIEVKRSIGASTSKQRTAQEGLFVFNPEPVGTAATAGTHPSVLVGTVHPQSESSLTTQPLAVAVAAAP